MTEVEPERSVDLSEKSTESNQSTEISNEYSNIEIHKSESVPMWDNFNENEFEVIFIDPSTGEGKRILQEPETTVPELLAVLRQFVPSATANMDLVVNELLDNRGMGVNDIDSTTGMTLLHYAVRSEANNKENRQRNLIHNLLDRGADPYLRSLYTDMNAIHYAAYYNSLESLKLIMKHFTIDEDFCIDSLCGSYNYGTPLHIAASALSYDVVKFLLQNGANPNAINDYGEKPVDCVPKHVTAADAEVANKTRRLLFASMRIFPNKLDLNKIQTRSSEENNETKSADNKKDMRIGQMVIVSGDKSGKLRFCGKVEFASGTWCGIELSDPIGKNNGSVNGVRYFKCSPNRGVFAPLSKVEIDNTNSFENSQKEKEKKKVHLKLGMTVHLTSHSEHGVIRYLGETKFSEGIWVGLELSKATGKNDGVVRGHRYFTCKPGHGILVRPDRVTLRGVSGSKLIPSDLKNN